MDLPASCLDQDKAVEKVGNKKQKAQIDILRANTKDKVKEAFDLWTDRINSVKVKNVPIFAIDGTVIRDDSTETNPFIHTTKTRSFTLRCKHPSDKIPGNAVLELINSNADPSHTSINLSIPKDEPTAFDAEITIADAYTGNINFTAAGRNICGPVTTYFRITTPASS